MTQRRVEAADRPKFSPPADNAVDLKCYRVLLPRQDDHRRLLTGQIVQLAKWYNYTRTDDRRGKDAAAVWKAVLEQLDFEDCDHPLCQAILDCIESSGGELGEFLLCLAAKIIEDCSQLLADQLLSLDIDYPDVFPNNPAPTFEQLNAQYIEDYGEDMPLPDLNIWIDACEIKYQWENRPIQSAGILDASTCPSLIGPPGPQGIQGLQGVPGQDGQDGQDCECKEPPYDPPGSADTTPYTSTNEVCGGMVAWRDYLFDWANYILDQREAEINGGLIVAKLIALFPGLGPKEAAVIDLIEGLADYTVSLARVQINDPDFQNVYMCAMYNLVYPGGAYTQAIHDAIADPTISLPIPNQTSLMDHMLYLVGWEKLNRIFRAGATEPTDICDALCADEEPTNPANLIMHNGEICSVEDLGNGIYRYTFLSHYNNGAIPAAPDRNQFGDWITFEYAGYSTDDGMLTKNRGSMVAAGCDSPGPYNTHTVFMIQESQSGGQVMPGIDQWYNVKYIESYGTAGEYYHTLDIDTTT